MVNNHVFRTQSYMITHDVQNSSGGSSLNQVDLRLRMSIIGSGAGADVEGGREVVAEDGGTNFELEFKYFKHGYITMVLKDQSLTVSCPAPW